MRLRSRQTQVTDLRGCAEAFLSDPVQRSRYGPIGANLASAWMAVLRSGSLISVVLEDMEPRMPRLVGLGVSVFVTDEFLNGCKTPPLFWIGPELTNRVQKGRAPILSPNAIRDANSGAGLNLVVWAVFTRGEGPEEINLVNLEMMQSFVRDHSGYCIKEMLGPQAPVARHVRYSLDNGLLVWNSSGGRYDRAVKIDLERLVRAPFILGITRELALRNLGTWVTPIFVLRPPLAFFPPSEQRLLQAALRGSTDEELSDELGVSLSFVKKAWRSIYDRAGVRIPELFPYDLPDELEGGRGKEKKQRLLSYVRDHPEELRPVSENRMKHDAPMRRSPQVSRD
jgi:hypothetical protein